MGILLITHDLGIVNELADRVAVMYAGRIVETATREAILARPAHPYTNALFESLPDLESEPGHLPTIPGMVPSAVDFPEGCRFRDRCSFATEACVVQPETTQLGDNHVAACHHLDAVQAAREGAP